MRFLELVPCARKASRRSAATRRAEEVAAVPTNPLPSSSAGAAAAAPSHGKQRRGASVAPVCGAAATSHWRPAFAAISEDGALRAAEGKGGRTTPAAPAARARRQEYRDDHRHLTAPAIFPAFDPTAFLF